jgi:hypothetical protein
MTLKLAIAGTDDMACAVTAGAAGWIRSGAVYPFPFITQVIIILGVSRSGRAARHVAKPGFGAPVVLEM